MTTAVTTIGPEEPALRAAELIWKRKIGCLPVVVDQKVVGIVTESDFVRIAMQELSNPRT